MWFARRCEASSLDSALACRSPHPGCSMKAALENNSPFTDLRKPGAEMCAHRSMATRTKTPLSTAGNPHCMPHRKLTTASVKCQRSFLVAGLPVVEGILILDREALVVYGE